MHEKLSRLKPIFLGTCRSAEGTIYFEWEVVWLTETTLNPKRARAGDHSGQIPVNLRDQPLRSPTYNEAGREKVPEAICAAPAKRKQGDGGCGHIPGG